VTFDGVMTRPGIDTGSYCESPNGCVLTPDWIAQPAGLIVAISAGDRSAAVGLALVPDLPNRDLLLSGTLPSELDIRVTASFDHPAAAECRLTDGPGGADLGPRSEQITTCRMRLVATAITWDAEDVALRPDTFALVVTDDLRVRSKPGVGTDSVRLEPLLQDGDSLFVVAGPISKDGYDWYQVLPRERWHQPFGWVAAADRNGAPWLQRADPPNCPVGESQWNEIGLAFWFAGEQLACYGDQEIVAQVWVHEHQAGHPEWNRGCEVYRDTVHRSGEVPCAAEPVWLASFTGLVGSQAETPDQVGGLDLKFDPSSGISRDDFPKDWTWMTVRGSFSHPASASCRIIDPDTGKDVLDPEEAALYCRMTFVVTSLEPAARPG
jgi:hypothetical protein